MNQQPLNERTMRTARDDMISFLTEEGYPPISVSVDDLVSVTIDARYQVRLVTIQGVKLKPDEASRLEQSLVKAINSAIQEMTHRNLERLGFTSQAKGKQK